MAGHVISLYLKEQGHDVQGVARKPSQIIDSFVGDVTNEEFVHDVVGNDRYDSIINCIGILNQFAEENHALATYVNAYFPHYLAQLTENTNTQIIHMSTDCVFSGNKGSYSEDDLRDGETFYDRSKALGELDDDKNITLRNSIVGPDINPKGIGLLNWFMQQHGEVNGYIKAIWTGQTTLQLAKMMEIAAKERIHGLYNAVPDSNISKCDLLRLFNNYLRTEKVTIVPVDKMAADKSLVRKRKGFDYIVPDYERMIVELSEWINSHKELYPHYKAS